MEYHGKLYGKIGDKYFETGKTSEDYDKLEEAFEELLWHEVHNTTEKIVWREKAGLDQETTK